MHFPTVVDYGRHCMVRMIPALILLATLFASHVQAQVCATSGELDPPLRSDEFLYQVYSPATGAERTALFQIPTTAPLSDRRLVIVLHGGGDRDLNDLLSHIRQTGWSGLAEREGIVLVYPLATKDPTDPADTFNWNDGRLGTGIWSMPDNQGVDDAGYLAEIMDIAQRDYGIGDRIYVMGISNGGMMAFRLASEVRTRDRIKAIATLVAQVPLDRAGGAFTAIPMLLINGTSDPLIPYRGGEILTQLELADGSPLGAPIYGGEVISARATLQRVLAAHACSTERRSLWVKDRSDDGTRVRIDSYCGISRAVQNVTVFGGGHRWHGQGDNSAESVRPCFNTTLNGYDVTYYVKAGLTTLDGFDATEAAWRFFRRH